MSTMEPGTNQKAGVKTLAIRLEPDRHAQLSLIAQLRGSTITDEIRQAIEAHIAAGMADPGLAAQAEGVLEDIEREAEARRAAIAALFGGTPATEGASQPGGEGEGRRRSRRSSEGSSAK